MLPTSRVRPSLNAEELCNAHVRNHLYAKRGSYAFLQEIYNAFATITPRTMCGYYRKVLNDPHKKYM